MKEEYQVNKRLTKPHQKNIRLDSPLGLLGVPPDSSSAPVFTVMNDKVIIIADKAVAMQLLSGCRDMGSLPQ